MRIFLTLLLLVAMFVNFYFGDDFFTSFEENYNKDLLSDALSAFALAKIFNAIISTVQSLELSFSFVAGASIQIGQLLDPINDLVERFSWIMLMASVSLGVQKVLLLAGKTLFFQIAIFVSALISILFLWLRKIHFPQALVVSLKILVILLIFRFGAVVFANISDTFYTHVYAKEYSTSMHNISIIKDEYKDLQKQQAQLKALKNQGNIDGFWDRLEAKLNHLSDMIVNVITIFVVTTVLLPLIFLWLCYILIKWIFNLKFDNAKITQLFKTRKSI